jgi:hypothetical protein
MELCCALRCTRRMGHSRLSPRLSVGSLAVLAGLIVVASFGGAPPASLSGTDVSPLPVCQATVAIGVLPMWARGGFSDPKPRMPYAVGRAGEIAGIVWGNPLQSPPKNHNNKILWVSRTPPASRSDLRISAQRMTGSTPIGDPVSRTVSRGPGPSIINLPSAGCWRFTLRWSGRTDTLDLRYRAS